MRQKREKLLTFFDGQVNFEGRWKAHGRVGSVPGEAGLVSSIRQLESMGSEESVL